MSSKKITWKRAPSDGTSYAYWERSDGLWFIETKPRFKKCPYTLELTRKGQQTLFPTGACFITFTTLAEAKEASTWPKETLLERMRSEYARFKRAFIWNVSEEDRATEVLAGMIEDAIEEDAYRARLKLQVAA